MTCHRPILALVFSAAAVLALPAAAQSAGADAKYGVGDRLTPTAPAADKAQPARKGDFKLTNWDALVPKDWDPMKELKGLNLGTMRDGDPRTTAALDRLKRAFDTAPTEPSMNNARIRIAGFVVPLDGEGGQMHEFLLVPYFGACIHTPPPPANQIIHVTSSTPIKGYRAMDPMWASGTLKSAISDTAMGTSGYKMELEVAAPYREKGQ